MADQGQHPHQAPHSDEGQPEGSGRGQEGGAHEALPPAEPQQTLQPSPAAEAQHHPEHHSGTQPQDHSTSQLIPEPTEQQPSTETPLWEAPHGPSADNSDLSSEDADSALGSFQSASSASITSAPYRFRWEHGRRYHALQEDRDDKKYLLPNDNMEMDRLDLQHHLFCMTLDALHRAPLDPERVRKAIDLGTGTGIWAIDFADMYPNTQVFGVDLSPIQPEYVPPNCQFYVEDVEKGWSWEPNTFDYVHTRMIISGIKNWPRLIEQAFESLRPGGWLEFQVRYNRFLEFNPHVTLSEKSDAFLILRLSVTTGDLFSATL